MKNQKCKIENVEDKLWDKGKNPQKNSAGNFKKEAHSACTSMWTWSPYPETHKRLRHVVHNCNRSAARRASWIHGACWASHSSPKKKIVSNNQGFYTHKCIYTCAHTYVPTTTETYTDIWPPYSDSNGKNKTRWVCRRRPLVGSRPPG